VGARQEYFRSRTDSQSPAILDFWILEISDFRGKEVHMFHRTAAFGREPLDFGFWIAEGHERQESW